MDGSPGSRASSPAPDDGADGRPVQGGGAGHRPSGWPYLRPDEPIGQGKQVGERGEVRRPSAVPVDERPAKPGPLGAADVVLGVIADAEDAAGREPEVGAGGGVEGGVRL